MNWNGLVLPDKDVYFKDDDVVMYCADCRDVLPLLPDRSIDLVLTDPPYGVNMLRGDSHIKEKIIGDDKIPDIRWVAQYPSIIWGGNNFCDQLPRSTGWLVWYKYATIEAHHSQAELAWTNIVRTIRHYSEQYTGFMRQREGQYHPTQKPIKLMKWCLSFMPKARLILDPYLGSGTTAIACKHLNRKIIGIEIEEKYCEIATKRCSQSVMKLEC